LPVYEKEVLNFYVIDPATLSAPDTILNWASNITESPFGHYLIKHGCYYIFSHEKIEKDNWYTRNKQNYKWTIQGLSGINGVSKTGKAALIFNRNRIKKTEQKFMHLQKNKPSFLV